MAPSERFYRSIEDGEIDSSTRERMEQFRAALDSDANAFVVKITRPGNPESFFLAAIAVEQRMYGHAKVLVPYLLVAEEGKPEQTTTNGITGYERLLKRLYEENLKIAHKGNTNLERPEEFLGIGAGKIHGGRDRTFVRETESLRGSYGDLTSYSIARRMDPIHSDWRDNGCFNPEFPKEGRLLGWVYVFEETFKGWKVIPVDPTTFQPVADTVQPPKG